MSHSPLVLALVLAIGACGHQPAETALGVERIASDIDQIGPLTAFEWDLIGTWTAVSTDTSDRYGVLGSIGDTCELADNHRLTCGDASGEHGGLGWWLADVDNTDPARGWITYVITDDARGGSVEIVLNGDVIAPVARTDTLWHRVDRPPRHKRPTERSLNTVESLTAGTWTTTEADDQLGARCTFARDLTLSCGPLDGTWSARRGLAAFGGAAIQPQLTVVFDDTQWSRSISFDASGMTIGAATTPWLRAR